MSKQETEKVDASKVAAEAASREKELKDIGKKEADLLHQLAEIGKRRREIVGE